MAKNETTIRDTNVGTFDFTVLNATGLKRAILTAPKFYVTVEIGDQVCRTKASARVARPLWNETFTFTANGSQNVKISLHRTRFIGQDVLLGSVTSRLVDFEPRNKEVDTAITITPGKRLATVTVKVGETIFSGPKCRVHALIIGIDQYINPSIASLNGCTNDAKAFKAFLTERLHVPDSQIILLMNKSATRAAIIDAFHKHLTTNTNIDEGDAILFFYAGHGSRVNAPEDWPATDGKIETLCPHDERMEDDKGDKICGIPDRTINAMLRELAAKKGDNITVIFDTCYSGGMTRKLSDKAPLTTRFVEPSATIQIPSSLDKDIWGSTKDRAVDVSIPTGFQHKYMASHVLLTACRQEQLAHEAMTTDGLPCGFFTDNLVKELRVVNLDRVTYTDLLSLLPELIDQTPHCEGENKNRFLFNGKATAGDPRAFKLVETDGIIEVLAGSIFGVIVGTEFAVQDLDAPDSRKDLGILVALSVDIDSSILGHRPGADIFEVPQGAKAIVSDWKNEALTLKVAVELEAKDQLVQALFPERDLKQPDQVARILKSRFVRVNARANADIVVKRSSADDQNLVIERLDSLIPKYANVTVQFNPANKLDNLPHIFDGISQFNYHLALHRGDDPFDQLVSLELFKLKRSLKGALLPDEDIGNVLISNDARLPVDGEALYGLDIINRSQHDLFPYLFYFDPSDYSISDWYIPLSPTVSAPLHGQQGPDPTRIPIGYGAGGGDPLVFTVNPGELSDTGFFKLFVFSKYIDMGWLRQPSAFESRERRKVRREPQGVGMWDAWIAAVTVYAVPQSSDADGSGK